MPRKKELSTNLSKEKSPPKSFDKAREICKKVGKGTNLIQFFDRGLLYMTKNTYYAKITIGDLDKGSFSNDVNPLRIQLYNQLRDAGYILDEPSQKYYRTRIIEYIGISYTL